MAKNNLPAVFSVQRGAVVTDGLFYSTLEDGRKVEIPVVRHGIRGIQTGEKDVSNIQRTETAKTHPEATGFQVEFAFRPIPAKDLVFACSDSTYRASIDHFVDTWFNEGVPEFDEVCRRYARNILNGSWLWRNNILGNVTVEARMSSEKDPNKKFVSAGSRRDSFDQYTEDEINLGKQIGLAICGHSTSAVCVIGKVDFGFKGAIEVFPSQNMVNNKPKGFARSLYKVDVIDRKSLVGIFSGARKDGDGAGEFMGDMIAMGHAALRDQKIANSIRTIDTWHGKGEAIAVEPMGESLKYNERFRSGAKTGPSLLGKIAEIKPGLVFNEDAAYLIALLERGGVFSEGKSD